MASDGSGVINSARLGKLIQTIGNFSLHMAKKKRQDVETDVLKLHNRIRMLQFEEDRALKKIEETRNKAKMMIEIKLANEKRARDQAAKS